MFQLFNHTKIDFMGKRLFFGVLSTLMAVIALVLLFSKGLSYGVDFKGGAEIQVKFTGGVSAEEVRATLLETKLTGIEVQGIGQEGQTTEYLIKVASSQGDLNATSEEVEATLSSKFKDKGFSVDRVDIVGPKAGEELKISGFQALFWAMLAIFIYVALRFDPRFAPGAVVALGHDALFVIFIWLVMGKEFTLQTVAAILAIVGYSVNDTVVIYDRIREELAISPDEPLIKIINRAINETLGRTVMTTLTTLFVVISLVFVGGDVIGDFAFALLVGNLSGIYSTIYVASNVTLLMDRFLKSRRKKRYSAESPSVAVSKAR